MKAISFNYDDLLHSFGYDIPYDKLTPVEKETFHSWLKKLESQQLTIENVAGYIKHLKTIVENELTKADIPEKQDIFLKARLRNLMLIESFLDTPGRASQALAKQMQAKGRG